MTSAHPEDVSSIEAIIATDYKIISAAAGEERDWDRMRTLFAPGARLTPIEKVDGEVRAHVMSVDEYIESRKDLLASLDFFEWETAREERREGRMAHVWSSYEAAATPHGKPIIRRGVNSIQLWNDGTRWWILSVTWDALSAAAIR